MSAIQQRQSKKRIVPAHCYAADDIVFIGESGSGKARMSALYKKEYEQSTITSPDWFIINLEDMAGVNPESHDYARLNALENRDEMLKHAIMIENPNLTKKDEKYFIDTKDTGACRILVDLHHIADKVKKEMELKKMVIMYWNDSSNELIQEIPYDKCIDFLLNYHSARIDPLTGLCSLNLKKSPFAINHVPNTKEVYQWLSAGYEEIAKKTNGFLAINTAKMVFLDNQQRVPISREDTEIAEILFFHGLNNYKRGKSFDSSFRSLVNFHKKISK